MKKYTIGLYEKAMPKTEPDFKPRYSEPEVPNGSISFIRDERGTIVGMLGHRLGEHKCQMRGSGSWCNGLMGRKFVCMLSTKVMNFSTVDFEYCKHSPYLWGICLIAKAGPHRSKQDVEALLKGLRDKIAREWGINLKLVGRGGWQKVQQKDLYLFSSYIFEQGPTVMGYPSTLRLTAYEENDGSGYTVEFMLNCFQLQRIVE